MVVFPEAIARTGDDPELAIERIFATNGWSGVRRNGIYDFHHYHSSAHEVLGVSRGSACLQVGGERGIPLRIGPGDVLGIPAGVALPRRDPVHGAYGPLLEL